MRICRPFAAIIILAVGLVLAGRPTGVLAQVPADQFSESLAELRDLHRRIEFTRDRLNTTVGQDRQIYAHQLMARWTDHHNVVADLAELADDIGADQLDGATRLEARAALVREIDAVEAAMIVVADSARRFRRDAQDLPIGDRFSAELALSEVYEIYRTILTWLVDDYEIVESLGLAIPVNTTQLDSAFVFSAGLVSADIEFATSRRTAFAARRREAGSEAATMETELAVLRERIASDIANLETLVALMKRRDLPTAEYERLLLTTTGSVGLAILNPEVLGGLFSRWGDSFAGWAATNAGTFGIRLLLILIVVIITRLLARMARRVATRIVASDRLTVSGLLGQLVTVGVSKAVWLIAFLVVMSVLGINVGPALAGLGIVGFVLGFALQDTLSNFAAGMMIMVYRPFDVGDLVTAGGVLGNVKDLTLVSTMITTLDNQLTVIPNAKVWGGVINNATAQATRRVDLEFAVALDTDITLVKRVLEEIVRDEEMILDDPAPAIAVHNVGDWAIDMVCRPWCRTENVLGVRWKVTEAVVRRFDAEGIKLPVPVSDVRIQPTESEIPAQTL